MTGYTKNHERTIDIPDNAAFAYSGFPMNGIIECAHCGKSMRYGDRMDSTKIFTYFGVPYVVCEDCREGEEHDE